MANTNTTLIDSENKLKTGTKMNSSTALSNTEKNDTINELEERINSLESRNLFQDDAIEQLSEELAVHQNKISLLQEQIQMVANRLKNAGELSSDKDNIEPPPPHY